MRALLVTLDYPSMESPASCRFIHTRAKAYRTQGLEVSVFVVADDREKYQWDGIEVEKGDRDDLLKRLRHNDYDKLLIHFFTHLIHQAILEARVKKQILIWVHGIEALSWKRRLFNLELNPGSVLDFSRYMIGNWKQLKSFREFVRNRSFQKKIIFVSNWMKQATENDLGIAAMESAIIPNMIDTTHFKYIEKETEQRNRILILRSFSTRKYANDLSIKAIKRLAANKIFKHLTLSIYGEGRLFHSLTSQVNQYQNVHIYNHFLNPAEMASVYQTHGIILIPTRQDAQGVTMCEAMSSGLVPVTSNNTAIPEFLTPTCGFLTRSVGELVRSLIKLHCEPDTFSRMSSCAASHIREICSEDRTLNREIELIRS